jgi:hypothetical protein
MPWARKHAAKTALEQAIFSQTKTGGQYSVELGVPCLDSSVRSHKGRAGGRSKWWGKGGRVAWAERSSQAPDGERRLRGGRRLMAVADTKRMGISRRQAESVEPKTIDTRRESRPGNYRQSGTGRTGPGCWACRLMQIVADARGPWWPFRLSSTPTPRIATDLVESPCVSSSKGWMRI